MTKTVPEHHALALAPSPVLCHALGGGLGRLPAIGEGYPMSSSSFTSDSAALDVGVSCAWVLSAGI